MSAALPEDLGWGRTWPELPEFRDLGATHRVVPVVRRLLADHLTPVGVYRALAQARPGSFILESAAADGSWGRYSFIGVRSRATLTSRDGRAVWTGDVPAGVMTQGDPLTVLADALRELATDPVAGLPPLTSGFVGAIGWDAIRYWEPTLVPRSVVEVDVPDVALCLVEDLAVVDHHSGAVWLIANAINGDGTSARVEQAHAAAVARLDAMARDLAAPVTVAAGVGDGGAETGADVPQVRPRTTQEDYEAAVEIAQQRIRDGEAFQIVLSQRFDLDCPAPPIDVYRALRAVNPSPYMYCVHLTDADGAPFAVVGSSPETLAQVQGDAVMTYPIAGSRPRGKDAAQDAELTAELLADPKERAEHLMLVDLGRNDLSKVTDPSTIRVSEFMDVRRFSHVMHLCSTVTGVRRPGAGALDALTATFPAGTLSGAPKPRAVAIIDELEPARRGVYGGTVGYLDLAGNLDMAIAIRTAVIKDGTAHVQAGAGIVADSRPSAEHAECVNKAAAVVRAVQLAARLRSGER
ncbi:anthranilate synthase component I [Litorihabitans aurantiacus]|uniref:Anthranilate synthase component 1 n=1 Tax=Litorihabitans aurantiacus TaxID=1930061 RepID=A0AA37UVI5_9MICO|nr:anthranilate synthase component I [Litorihabitans aurantiacus]GMA31122.1 anthranilate synthase component I [Litorihabitans aurantiacus]